MQFESPRSEANVQPGPLLRPVSGLLKHQQTPSAIFEFVEHCAC
jgi:hypothetical protein